MNIKLLSHAIVSCLILSAVFLSAVAYSQQHKPGEWCSHRLRPGLEKLKEIKTSFSWFKVFDVGNRTYAIVEPYNWEETISYLIIGKQKALLFDTGMGLARISSVIKQLTTLPVIVLNSHTHPDHIGGNAEFETIYAMNTSYTKQNAAHGYTHNEVKWEVSPQSFCLNRLPETDTAHYRIRQFKIKRVLNDRDKIDLGDRQLMVISTPGHTPDAICLYEHSTGNFWCGDSFYEGPILLTDQVTSLKAYKVSIGIMAHYARSCKTILPAHNLPVVEPELVVKAARCFGQIIKGGRKGEVGADGSAIFWCGKFSYQINQELLTRFMASAKNGNLIQATH